MPPARRGPRSTSRALSDAHAQAGQNIRRARTDLGYTQAELAATLRISVQTLRAWENGRVTISSELMERLASAVDRPPEQLWPGWTEETSTWGGQRQFRPEAHERIDHLEAELASLREILERKGIIEPRATDLATGVAQALSRAPQPSQPLDERSKPTQRARKG